MNRIRQIKRLNPEPLQKCAAVNCKYPVCHCFDAETISKEKADELLLSDLEDMLSRLRIFIDDLKRILSAPHYYSYPQLREYKKRKIRLVKNFNFLKIKYDLIKFNRK